MAKYKTKPCEIEAIQWNGTNLEEIKEFVGESLIYDIIDTAWQVGKGRPHVYMKIRTLEGDMKASEGDFIIKGLKGEFYPCKPDVFNQKYVQNATKPNADRIRNMTDEELAEWIHNISHDNEAEEPNVCIYDLDQEKEIVLYDSYGDLLEWLQAEVEEGD